MSGNFRIIEVRRSLWRLSSPVLVHMPLFRVGLTASSLVMSSWVLSFSKYWDSTSLSAESVSLFDPPCSGKHYCYVYVGFAVVQLVHNCLLSSQWIWIHLLYSPPLFHPQCLYTQGDWPLLSPLFWVTPALSLLISGVLSPLVITEGLHWSRSLQTGAQHWVQSCSWEQWWLHSAGTPWLC